MSIEAGSKAMKDSPQIGELQRSGNSETTMAQSSLVEDREVTEVGKETVRGGVMAEGVLSTVTSH